MKRFLIFFLALFILVSAVVGGIAAYGWHLFTNTGPLQEEVTLILEKGSGLRSISRKLMNAGVIHNDFAFMFGVRIRSQEKNLKAGEFEIVPGLSGEQVLALLVSGKTAVYYLTIPEGLQSREIADLISQNPVLSGDLTIPLVEGSLLPETYQLRRGDSKNSVAERMISLQKSAIDDLWKNRKPDPLITSKTDLLILASIVEKETGLATERAHVAGVFLNRLKRKMRLQSDPTVAYGVTNGVTDLGRPISKKDLAAKNKYNTYTLKGLPAGPICNPGLDSLKAVLSPMKTKDLYFVADGTGGHVFAPTLKEHNRNVRNWRKFKKSKSN
ncbi:MAG: endolytic transglycosylase MltG [Pseudomonas marincola]